MRSTLTRLVLRLLVPGAHRSMAAAAPGALSRACADTTGSRDGVAARLKRIAAATESSADWSPGAVAEQLRALAAELDKGSDQQQQQPEQHPEQTQEQQQRAQQGATMPAETQVASAVSRQDLERLERSWQASTANGVEAGRVPPRGKKARRGPREFDASQYRQRYVVLELMYVGWGFHGFARQVDSENTIEGHLFKALRHTRLIPPDADISELCYSRCGRTDKGVSALGQVLALNLRSVARAGEPEAPLDSEIDYVATLNRALPEGIRVLGWAPAPQGFSARFSALYREYLYFMVHDGDLNVAAMEEAAALLVGDHDFRNFCKPDVEHVRNFRRRVLSAGFEVAPCSAGGHQVVALRLRGTAFLWHQVRCIAAVLLMVGRGLEAPSVFSHLLDVEAVPAKPQYNMAPEHPLLLFACAFEGLPAWRRSQQALRGNDAAVSALLERQLVGAALVGTMLQRLRADGATRDVQPAEAAGSAGSSARRQARPQVAGPPHVALLKRPRGPPLEERFRRAGVDPALLNLKGHAGFGTASQDDMQE